MRFLNLRNTIFKLNQLCYWIPLFFLLELEKPLLHIVNAINTSAPGLDVRYIFEYCANNCLEIVYILLPFFTASCHLNLHISLGTHQQLFQFYFRHYWTKLNIGPQNSNKPSLLNIGLKISLGKRRQLLPPLHNQNTTFLIFLHNMMRTNQIRILLAIPI